MKHIVQTVREKSISQFAILFIYHGQEAAAKTKGQTSSCVNKKHKYIPVTITITTKEFQFFSVDGIISQEFYNLINFQTVRVQPQ